MILRKPILSYEEQVRYSLPVINFEYLISHPEEITFVGEKYLTDYGFRNRVLETMSLNPYFKSLCMQYIGDYVLEFENCQHNAEKSTLKGR